jgi:hypothetical protein
MTQTFARTGACLLVTATCALAHAAAEDIPLASPHAAAVETPSAPDAWGGPRTGNEPTLSDRVVRYEIDATLDPETHGIDATENLTWRNRSDREVKSLYVHLYLNAFEGPGSTFFTEQRERGLLQRDLVQPKDGEWGHIELVQIREDGDDVPFTFVHPDGGPDTDHTVARFDLPHPVRAGERVTLGIRFRDRLPRIVARTGYVGSFHMVGQWFPKIGVLELPGERGATSVRWNVHEFHTHSEFYADWGEYNVRITVPRGYEVASAGEQQGPPVENGDRVTLRFTQGDIHDFVWMAARDFAPPLEGSYDGPGSPHVVVKVFYPPEYEASAAPSLKATIDALRYFSETLGPYPYRTSTCVIPPYRADGAGGMEYQTLFTGYGFADVEPDTFAGAIVNHVVIHEFGHGYFYGVLASNEFEEPVLDEGLDQTWNFRMMRDRGELAHWTTPFWKRLGFDPAFDAFAAMRNPFMPHPPDPIGQNAWDRLSSFSYSSVYSRTTLFVHDLEERFGREPTERGFRAYFAKWRFRHPSTADWRESLVEATGERAAIERAFAQTIYGTSAFDDRIESLTSEEMLPLPGTTIENGKWVEHTKESVDREIEVTRASWKKTHADDSGSFPFRTIITARRDGASVPQTLIVKFEDGSVETVRWDDDQPWRRFTFVKPARAKSAELDPDRRILLDENKLNDGMTREPDRTASRRWASDLWSVVETAVSLVVGAL